jgi:glycosyltransferase involved in cell wall biosynthesis
VEPTIKKISVIISAFNAEKYIATTLESVLAQTYTNLEIIVVNDGSTDKTLEIANAFLDKRLTVLTQENKGQDAALNNGFNHSSGDYIKFMDSDDLINPEMIDIQMKALNGRQSLVAYGEWARFYSDNILTAEFKELSNWKDMTPIDFLTSMPIGPMLQCGIMLIPRKLIETAGLWDERLILFNDTEFFTRILLNSEGIRFTPGARLYYRSGLNFSISAQRTRKYFESTFLATNLIADNLIRFEDSKRTRQLIANIYFNQYFEMYPFYSDLLKQHISEIQKYGGSDITPDGGRVFRSIKLLLGWKMAKIIQLITYKLGYVPGRLYN